MGAAFRLTRTSARYVVLLLVTAVLVSGCKFDGAYDLPLPGSDKVSRSDAIKVTADFADALNVVPHTEVMANDTVVGQVSDVERVGWHARVTFLVRKDIDLPANVEIDVRQTSLLGEKYLALVEPPSGTASSQRLQDGAFIPLSRTSRNPEVEEVLGALSMLLSGGGIGQLKTISVEMNKMLNGRQDQARDLLANLDTMVGALDKQKNDIIAAMDSVNRLSRTLVKEKDVIGAALDSMGPALKVLNQQHQALMTMLRQLDKLGVVGTRVLNASTDNIVASLRHLQPVLTKLGDAGDSLPNGLSLLASFPFPKEAGDIARGDYANALFHLDFDLGTLVKSPGDVLPNLVNLCSALPISPACDALSPALKATVCAALEQEPGNLPDVASVLCPPGSKASKTNPLPGLLGGLTGSGSSGSSSGSTNGGGSGGGLGGALGGLLDSGRTGP
jgi:phospholipid/cholesterol/gamma-HCH transport system substrate-binding protein